MREEIIGDCRLILGDCLEVMEFLDSVDHVITDPPYEDEYQETKAKISAKKIGTKHAPETQAKINLNLTECGKPTRFVKGRTPWNKGIKMEKEFNNV